MWSPYRKNHEVVNIADENNAYLEEQSDGSYIFYYDNQNGFSMEVSAEDVEAGLYDFYPIVEYQKENNNAFMELFITIQESIKNIFLD